MKLFKVLVVAGVSAALLSGCGSNNNAANDAGAAATTAPATEQTDAKARLRSLTRQMPSLLL